MATEVGHPSGMSATEPEGQADLEQLLDGAELRSSLVVNHSAETLRAWRKRVAHYQEWCRANGHQFGTEHITNDLVLAYVRAQCLSGELRPNTLRQAVRALAVAAERATGAVIGVHEPRELIRLWEANAGIEPAYRVTREVHRPNLGRRTGTA